MKVLVPIDSKDITLGQYQEYIKLTERTDLDSFEYDKRKLKIFLGLAYRDVEKMQQSDYFEILNMIDVAIETPNAFEPRFKINDVEFGFVTNFDELKAKEWFDLSTYDIKGETLHNLMAILFRPITAEVKNNGYEIMEYQGTDEWAQVMKKMPLHIVNGALVFFWNLSKELSIHTLRYTSQAQLKLKSQVDISINGVGIQHLMKLLRGSLGSTSM